MSFRLLYTPEANRGIEKIEAAGLKWLCEKKLLSIAENPYLGKRLTGHLKGLYSARVTRRYRIIYQIRKETNDVLILDVAHRKKSYR